MDLFSRYFGRVGGTPQRTSSACSSEKVGILLHADKVRSARTTDTTKVPAEKVYNF
jgi:hypothetical protein